MSGKLSEKDKEFAYAYIANRETYHNHKEQMAYVAFLVQTAFFTALMTFNWDFRNEGIHVLVIIVSVVFWALIHFFLRWQLRLRREAALEHAAILINLLNNLNDTSEIGKKKVDNTSVPKQTDTSNRRKSRFFSLLDLILWPCPKVIPKQDIPLSKYPIWFQEELESQRSKGTGASCGEIIVTLGSWLILVGIIIRLTVLSCT